jgi:diacylglycerol diphosphate phosphatase/phosphatidate phosphatase
MSHNWYDILAGSLIGIAMALLSYRMCFASVFDFRWNHVPLRRGANRGSEEVMGMGYTGKEMRDWCGGCATRRAGWGVARGNVVGAPGDSSAFFVSDYIPEMREGFGNVGGPNQGVHGNHQPHDVGNEMYNNGHPGSANGVAPIAREYRTSGPPDGTTGVMSRGAGGI